MNNKNLKCLIPYRLHINSAVLYKTFFKKQYNHVHSLELEVFHSSRGNRIRTKMIKRKLEKIGKRVKSVQSLNLQKSLLYHQAEKDPQFLSLIKRFSNLRCLSVSYPGRSDELLGSYAKWIAYLKRLKRLNFIFRSFVSENTVGSKFTVKLKKFVRALKFKKLYSLRLLLEANYHPYLKPFINLKNYPSCLKKLILIWNGYGVGLQSLPLSKSKYLLSHMKDLRDLHIALPVPVSLLRSIISSVPFPEKIRAARLEIFNKGTLNFLGNGFEKFGKLRRLSLKFKNWPGTNVSYWKVLNVSPLTELNLDVPIEEASNLLFLGDLIRSTKGLKDLSLKILVNQPVDFGKSQGFPLFIGKPKYFEKFFKFTDSLSQLKKLKIYFIFLYPSAAIGKSFKFISSFAAFIKNLQKLEELSIRFRQGNKANEYKDLLSILEEKAPSLRKFRINFAGQKLANKDMQKLAEVLSQAKNLQVLTLDEIVFENMMQFESLETSLYRLKNLEKLKLNKIGGELDLKIFADFVAKIITKQGFRKLQCTENLRTKKNITHSKKIDFRNVVKVNPLLELAYIPFDRNMNKLFDVSFSKWN